MKRNGIETVQTLIWLFKTDVGLQCSLTSVLVLHSGLWYFIFIVNCKDAAILEQYVTFIRSWLLNLSKPMKTNQLKESPYHMCLCKNNHSYPRTNTTKT